MMQFHHFALIVLATILAGCVDQIEEEPELPPYRFRFGMVQNGQIVEVAGNQIPFRPGSEYGWILDLENPNGTVIVREAFTLPSPTAWKFDNEEKPPDQVAGMKTEKVRIKESGQVFSKEMEITAYEHISHLSTYKILASDPLGTYVLEVFLNDQPAFRLEFELVEEEETKKVRLS
ncbi:MAG: hypothetical protein AAGH89_09950 [Verrucomicrobiota bacterium]